MPVSILTQTKKHLFSLVEKGDPKFSYLPRHIKQVERWADRLCKMFPQADEEIVKLSVFLHDIGLIVGDSETDHAINSSEEAIRFLTEIRYPGDRVKRISHATRAHRCKDVQPKTIEAKIVAAADSASHMTDIVYIDMANRGDRKLALEKLERDIRDVGVFPELRKKMIPLYQNWKNLLEVYPDPDTEEES